MITEDMKLNRKLFLDALETQPEEMRTRGTLVDCGSYCAVGLAATIADIEFDEMTPMSAVYVAVEDAYGMTMVNRDQIVYMNDKITYDENEDGMLINVQYVYTWEDIARSLRKHWEM